MNWLEENMNSIVQGDSYELIKKIPDNSIDLVIIDPPYLMNCGSGGGAFGRDKRNYHNELDPLTDNYNLEILDELIRVMKKVNIYIWCSKEQIYQYIDYFKKYNMELLTWHKTNPVPTCNNKYLSDTEYLLFFREKGVKIYGEYKTKRKYYITPTNKADKEKYKHPTVKPIDIIENLIINSSKEGDVVLDCFTGSGTTCVASKKLDRNFIGIEIDDKYFEIAKKRIEETIYEN